MLENINIINTIFVFPYFFLKLSPAKMYIFARYTHAFATHFYIFQFPINE